MHCWALHISCRVSADAYNCSLFGLFSCLQQKCSLLYGISLVVIGMCCEWRFSLSLLASTLKKHVQCIPLKFSNTFWYLLILTHHISAYGISIHIICFVGHECIGTTYLSICLKVAISLLFDWTRRYAEMKLMYIQRLV